MFKDSMAFGSYEFILVIDPDAERRFVHKEILEGLRGQKQNESLTYQSDLLEGKVIPCYKRSGRYSGQLVESKTLAIFN